jgi:hypothetical protein
MVPSTLRSGRAPRGSSPSSATSTPTAFEIVSDPDADGAKKLKVAWQLPPAGTSPERHGGRVGGSLTMDDVGEFVAIQTALSDTR